MEMKKFIEMGEKKAGKQIELAKHLNIRPSTLRIVKSGRTSLPAAICIELARYIDVDELEVIAASNLIIEKNEERRKIFESCFKTARTASIVIALGAATMISPTTVNAETTTYKTMYIM
ncbi:MAG: hypothetical protein NMNS01_27260 [Nitrosomonas sp.]|nr:MAG: hypothetical protein NMNS01_27260 [Nitrosomonas sp.]